MSDNVITIVYLCANTKIHHKKPSKRISRYEVQIIYKLHVINSQWPIQDSRDCVAGLPLVFKLLPPGLRRRMLQLPVH